MIDNKKGLFVEELACLVAVVVVFGFFLSAEVWIVLQGTSLPGGPLTVLWRGCGVQLRCCGSRTKMQSERAQGLPYCRATPEAC